MSLVDDRANIIADLENDLQRTREAWKYYKQLMLRNTLEGWERVDSGLQAVATYYKMEIVRVNHDVARYMRGFPVTGEMKWGGYNYGDNTWVDIILSDVDSIHTGLADITRHIKRRNKHEKGNIWYEAWDKMIELEFVFIERATYHIEENGKYLAERFTYGGQV